MNLAALTVTAFSRVPCPNIFIPSFSILLTAPVDFNNSAVTSVPFSNLFKS